MLLSGLTNTYNDRPFIVLSAIRVHEFSSWFARFPRSIQLLLLLQQFLRIFYFRRALWQVHKTIFFCFFFGGLWEYVCVAVRYLSSPFIPTYAAHRDTSCRPSGRHLMRARRYCYKYFIVYLRKSSSAAPLNKINNKKKNQKNVTKNVIACHKLWFMDHENDDSGSHDRTNFIRPPFRSSRPI